MLAVLCAGLAALSAAYSCWPARSAGFVNWDDGKYAADNPAIRELTAQSALNFFAAPHLGLYKPLTFLSLALDWRLGGGDPKVFHKTNIALHALNAALVFGLCFLLTDSVPAALLAALAFAAHPMRAESVAWISERKDVLYSFFFLLSSCCWLLWREGRGKWLYCAALAAFALSLAAKPMGVTLPAALLLFEWMKNRPLDKTVLKASAPFLALAALLAALTLFWVGQSGMGAEGVPWARRLGFAVYGLWFYFQKALWPSGLCCYYPYPPEHAALPPQYFLAPLGVAAFALSAWKFLRGNRTALGGLLFYTLCLLPVLGFFPVGRTVTADRYSYMAQIGLFLACAVLLEQFYRRLAPRRLALLLPLFTLAALAIFAQLARERCRVWQDSVSLWSDALGKNRAEPLIRAKLAEAYLERRDFARAEAVAENAVEENAADAELLNNYAAALDGGGKPEAARTVLEKASVLYAGHPGLNYNLGVLYARAGLFAQAQDSFEKNP